MVQNDPKEKGERALLNFGHTIGHAIEKLSDFTLYHGECVALGMVAAAYISFKSGNISKEDLEKIEHIISAYNLPIRLKTAKMCIRDRDGTDRTGGKPYQDRYGQTGRHDVVRRCL